MSEPPGRTPLPPGERGFEFVARAFAAGERYARDAQQCYLERRTHDLRLTKDKLLILLWQLRKDIDALPDPPGPTGMAA